MGQMIKIIYVGAFITPTMDNFQKRISTDEFYEEFNQTDIFRTAYEGLETINVLIPSDNKYAIKDEHNRNEFIIHNLDELKPLEDRLKKDYAQIIERLDELFPDGIFEVKSGIVSYWDEIA